MSDKETCNQDIIIDQDGEDIIETTPYDLKERKLVTQPYDMSVQTVVEQISNGDIDLGPDYQREYRWDNLKGSRFIESLLLNIPIPNIFLAEEEDVTYTVIDGRQRLQTIKKFIAPENNADKIILDGLQVRSDLNGKTFEELASKDQGRLKKQYLRCSVILNDSDPQIKFDVFERLNTGSEKLTHQEIRNCIYRGPFNQMLHELAENPTFLSMLNLSNRHQNDMTSEEYVLRFFAFYWGIQSFTGSINQFLNTFMRETQNLDKETIAEYKKLFEKAVANMQLLLGNSSFKRLKENGGWHSITNRAVYDAEMVAAANCTTDHIKENKDIILKNIKNSMKTPDFIKAIDRNTTTPSSVQTRIAQMKKAFCIKL